MRLSTVAGARKSARQVRMLLSWRWPSLENAASIALEYAIQRGSLVSGVRGDPGVTGNPARYRAASVALDRAGCCSGILTGGTGFKGKAGPCAWTWARESPAINMKLLTKFSRFIEL